MKCKGKYDCCGEGCPDCVRFMNDCDGHPDYLLTDDELWVAAEEEEKTDNVVR